MSGLGWGGEGWAGPGGVGGPELGGGAVGVDVVGVAALHAGLPGSLVPHGSEPPGRVVAVGLPAGWASVPAPLAVDRRGLAVVDPLRAALGVHHPSLGAAGVPRDRLGHAVGERLRG